jgi:hypothetical protein
MKTFKELLTDLYLYEGKHDPESDEHRFKLLDLEHSAISKDKNSPNYEDKVANALKGLKSETHGPDTVRKYLEKFHNTPNRWIRMHVAKHPELHGHEDLHKTLLSDSSPKVSSHASEPRKSSAPKAAKPAAAPAAVATKPKVAKAPSPSVPKAKVEKPSGKMEVVPGDKEEYPYASNVSHIMRGKKKLGTVVSGVRPSEMGNDEPFSHSYVAHKYEGETEEGSKPLGKHPTHQHGLLHLVNHLKGTK